jgi:hypothetical protein
VLAFTRWVGTRVGNFLEAHVLAEINRQVAGLTSL